MGANLDFRERAIWIGGGTRIIPGCLPEGLPDIRADVGKGFIGEQVGGGGRSGRARRYKLPVGCA